MATSLRPLALLPIALTLLILSSSSHTAARQASPCDSSETHGAYTPNLCPGDSLVSGSYISSPNFQFRLYVGSCDAPVYDVSDYENWSFQYHVYYRPDNCLFRLTYSDPSLAGIADSPINISWRDSNDELISYSDVEFQPDGGHMLTINDTGCVTLNDQDGARVTVLMGPYPHCQ